MNFRFDIGDMVLVSNTKSLYWHYVGIIRDSEYDSEKNCNIYYVNIGSEEIKKFTEQELRLDDIETEPTEIVN